MDDRNDNHERMKAFFIVGVQRSGTTLLSVMLGNHPLVLMEKRAVGFRLITCFKNLYDLLPFNIQHDKKAFTAWLIKNDVKGRLKSLIDFENINRYGSIRELIQASVEQKLSREDKLIWGDKSPNLQHYLSDLLLLMPSVKILHVVRDGRANAHSMSNRSYRNLSLSAQQWVDGNSFGLVNKEIIGEENYQMIHYEDLLQKPEKVSRVICKFLNIDYASEMVDLSGDRLNREKSYVKNFFDQSKIDKWKTELSAKQIEQIEKIQGPLLREFGYEWMSSSEELNFKQLSLRRRIWYNQKDNFKQLFRGKQIGMKDQELVELDITLKSRVSTFIRLLVRDLLSMPIFKSLFSRFFYAEKYYEGEQEVKD